MNYKTKTPKRLSQKLKRFSKSSWFFPALLFVPVIVFTALGINGSSVGSFHKILYGESKDSGLLLNEPRAIRSDEWLVNTQQALQQSENDFLRTNKNVGNGQDMSTVDIPYKDWSIIFKPHNLGFFVLPFENAFAFKWWLMGYFLLVSCYFFVLALLPGKKLLASLLSVALFFSAFVQWWYAYGSLGPLYYSLFAATLAIYISRQEVVKKKILVGIVLAYILACFALVLYPPFQVSCALALIAFLAGYGLQNYRIWGKQKLIKNLMIIVGGGLISILIAGLFIMTRLDVVRTISNTAYPGRRSVESGKFFPVHFMSSHLGYQFTSFEKTGYYLIDGKNPSNQSETSNFLLLLPLLLLPSIVLIYKQWRHKKPLDWPLVLVNAMFVVFLLHLFAPWFTPFAKLLLLDKVGDARLLIGIGLLNLMTVVLLIRNLAKSTFQFSHGLVIIYTCAVFAAELWLSLYAHNNFGPFFIGATKAVLFSIPLPVVVYLLLRKKFLAAVVVYAAFSVFISAKVNPLYKGLNVITKDPLSVAIKEIGKNSDEKWITQGGFLENMASINGEPSLSGTYLYPQHDLWDNIPNTNKDIYNRYAHVGFRLQDDPATPTTASLITADSFLVSTSVCSSFLAGSGVKFAVTSAVLKSPCAAVERTISYPYATLYIYRLIPELDGQ